jgi:hypothetical protein
MPGNLSDPGSPPSNSVALTSRPWPPTSGKKQRTRSTGGGVRRGELRRSPPSIRDRVVLLVTSQTLIDQGVTMLYAMEADAEDPGPLLLTIPVLVAGEQRWLNVQPAAPHPLPRGGDPMSASTEPTTDHQVCLGCDQPDGARWVTSTPETDLWCCRYCGTEWTIVVCAPAGSRG